MGGFSKLPDWPVSVTTLIRIIDSDWSEEGRRKSISELVIRRVRQPYPDIGRIHMRSAKIVYKGIGIDVSYLTGKVLYSI